MKKLLFAYFFFMFLCIKHQINAQIKLSKFNFAELYDHNFAVQSYHQIYDLGDSLEINLQFVLNPEHKLFKGLITRDIWYMDYKIYPSFESKSWIKYDTLWLKSNTYIHLPNTKYFVFKIPKISSDVNTSIMLLSYLEDNDQDTKYLDIPISYLNKSYAKKIKITNFKNNLILKPFFNTKDTVKFLGIKNESKIKVNYYKYTFPPAYPPMFADPPSDVFLNLKPDSQFVINQNTSVFDFKKGIYEIQFENDNSSKMTFGVFDNQFPKTTKPKELSNPLIYISTDEERQIMKQPENQKLKLDEYWLKIANNKTEARLLIKTYYRRVNAANKLFSSYKEGWKTDQGMIYCVFGNPTEVVKMDTKMLWFYTNKIGETNAVFEFQKKTSYFDNTIYELKNGSEYGSAWYSAVDKWRKGLVLD